jgi:hypothetical protein
MAALCQSLLRLRDASKTALIVVHHVRKSIGREEIDSERPAGLGGKPVRGSLPDSVSSWSGSATRIDRFAEITCHFTLGPEICRRTL